MYKLQNIIFIFKVSKIILSFLLSVCLNLSSGVQQERYLTMACGEKCTAILVFWTSSYRICTEISERSAYVTVLVFKLRFALSVRPAVNNYPFKQSIQIFLPKVTFSAKNIYISEQIFCL